MFMNEATEAHANITQYPWKHIQTSLIPYNHRADYIYFLAEYTFRQKCTAEEAQ
jgi:hypothetical protein